MLCILNVTNICYIYFKYNRYLLYKFGSQSQILFLERSIKFYFTLFHCLQQFCLPLYFKLQLHEGHSNPNLNILGFNLQLHIMHLTKHCYTYLLKSVKSKVYNLMLYNEAKLSVKWWKRPASISRVKENIE